MGFGVCLCGCERGVLITPPAILADLSSEWECGGEGGGCKFSLSQAKAD